MRKFTFETQGTHSYLVYRMTQEDVIDTLSLGMIRYNQIPGFAPMIYTQINTEKQLKYNISSKVTLKQTFSKVVNKQQFLSILSSIVTALMEVEEYMLEPGQVVLDLEYLFWEPLKNQLAVICLPFEMGERENVDIQQFFKEILFSAQFSQEENCDYVARLLNYFHSIQRLSLTDLKEMLEQLKMGGPADNKTNESQLGRISRAVISPIRTIPSEELNRGNAEEEQNAEEQQKIKENQETAAAEEKKKRLFLFAKREKKEKPKEKKRRGKKAEDAKQKTVPEGFEIPGRGQEPSGDEKQSQTPEGNPGMESTIVGGSKNEYIFQGISETVVLNGGEAGETMVLGQSQEPESFLMREKTGERVLIRKEKFTIGLSHSMADYCIEDNSYISKNHACILRKGMQYYIVDQGSRNYTYVNGQRIFEGVEMPIENGTEICLANEKFTFRTA